MNIKSLKPTRIQLLSCLSFRLFRIPTHDENRTFFDVRLFLLLLIKAYQNNESWVWRRGNFDGKILRYCNWCSRVSLNAEWKWKVFQAHCLCGCRFDTTISSILFTKRELSFGVRWYLKCCVWLQQQGIFQLGVWKILVVHTMSSILSQKISYVDECYEIKLFLASPIHFTFLMHFAKTCCWWNNN